MGSCVCSQPDAQRFAKIPGSCCKALDKCLWLDPLSFVGRKRLAMEAALYAAGPPSALCWPARDGALPIQHQTFQVQNAGTLYKDDFAGDRC